MTTRELIERCGQALAADAVLNAWCQTEFGKTLTILLDIDDAEPPGEDDYPHVAFLGVDQTRGLGEREVTWTLSMVVGVWNKAIEVSGAVKTRKGFLQAEQLRESVEDALIRARILSNRSESEASSASNHPLYVSFTAIIFRALRHLTLA